jgi:hypothetical protein
VDALAVGADEGRDRLRKAPGSRQVGVISGDVRMGKPGWGNAQSLWFEHIEPVEATRGTETSQYSEEKKATATP